MSRCVPRFVSVRMLVTAAAVCGFTVAHLSPARANNPKQEISWSLADLKQKAARRWPQPIRVGDFGYRLLIEPSDHQHVLGRVAGAARTSDGETVILVFVGGVLGVGARTVAVPIESVTLLGQFMELMDLTKDQLSALPDWNGDGATRLGPNDVVRIGLSKN